MKAKVCLANIKATGNKHNSANANFIGPNKR